jgi:hypothetical protein
MAKYKQIKITLTAGNQAKLVQVIQNHLATRSKGEPRLRWSPFWVTGEPVYFSGPEHLLAAVQAV